MILTAGLILTACLPAPLPETDDASDFGAYFFDARNWEVLRGAAGEKPVSLDDGSVKFYNANHYIELAETGNRLSFMLKGLNDWEIRFLASANSDGGHYFVLKKSGGGIYLEVSAGGGAELITASNGYESGKWTRFDIDFTQNQSEITARIYVNRARAGFFESSLSDNVSVQNDTLNFKKTESFFTGSYFIVKVRDNETIDYLQLKPVSKRGVIDTPKVACIGDSITEGGNTKTYPLQLQEMLGSGYNVVNFGKSGKTMLKSGDAPYWDNYCFSAAKLYVPDIIVIMLGSNDAKTYQPLTAEAFKADLTAFINVFKELNENVRVIINTSPKAHLFIYNISDTNIKDKVVPAQKAVAANLGLALIDIYAWTETKGSLFRDGIHPNDKGNEFIAKLVYFTVSGTAIPQNFSAGY